MLRYEVNTYLSENAHPISHGRPVDLMAGAMNDSCKSILYLIQRTS